MATQSSKPTASWFVRGDVDGFFGLAIDNLVQLIVIGALLTHVLGFDSELVLGRVLPGAAVSVVFGNLFYAWQAMRLARRTGRDDITALPYGINTVSLFAFVFLVMLPAKLGAEAAGASVADASLIAWRMGLVACFGSAILEIAGSFVSGWIRRNTPRAAMLAALAGVAVSFIALGFFFKTFGHPIVGFTTFVLVLVSYFGGVRFRGGIPGGFVAVLVGTVLAWATGLVSVSSGGWDSESLGIRLPLLALGDLIAAIGEGSTVGYLSVVIPMGLVNVIGSLQNIESAAAEGDDYDTQSSLLANGFGSLAAVAFGSCFPTTIYIGHPGWKRLGARIGYSILNAGFMVAVCLSGSVLWISSVVPVEAGMAIVLWIGVIIVAQAFEASERRHAPAVAIGLLPGIAAWGAFMMKQGMRAAGLGTPGGPVFDSNIEPAIRALDISPSGAFAIEQGFLFTAMVLAALTVEIIERRFRRAALWAFVGAVLAWFGLIHAYAYTPGDTVLDFGWGTGAEWAFAYAICGGLLMAVPFLTEDSR